MSSRREALIVRVLVGVAMATALGAAILIAPNAPKASEALTHLGRFHILVLHLPIGVLTALLLAEAGTLLRRHRRRADVIVSFLLPLLVATGAAAIVLGLLLAHGESYPAKLIARHRNLTVSGVMLAGITTFLLPFRARAGRWGHRALLFIVANLIGPGAHFGGTITHGADFLFPSGESAKKSPVVPEDSDAGALALEPPTEDASVTMVPIGDASATPTAMDAAAPIAAATVDAAAPPKPKVTSKQIVQAMVNSKCSPCHTSKSKGGLRMTDISNISKAGEVVPGDPGSSKIYARLTLPADHDDHMPPQGEKQASAGEIAAVRKWITELGAAP